jgi:hypothetical protein
MKREDYIKQLHENEIFKSVLGRSKDEAERRAIKAYTEDFMMRFYRHVFEPLEKTVQNDPNALKNVLTQMRDDLLKSGSIKSNS